jgi:tetratricopeptide (TPR) repeat protein
MATTPRPRRPILLLLLVLSAAVLAVLLRSRYSPSSPRGNEPAFLVPVRAQLLPAAVLTAEADLERSPADPRARRRLANVCSRASDPVGAALALCPLVDQGDGDHGRSGPADPTLHDPALVLEYARACTETGWLDEAERMLRRLSAAPQRAWLDLAAAYAEHGQADRATSLLRAVPVKELQAEEWLEGAITWYYCRRPEQAVQWARAAAEKPEAGEGAAATGSMSGGDRISGESWQRDAAADASAARVVLARALLAAGQPEAALEALLTSDGAVSLSDPRVEFWRGRAEARCQDASLRASGRERLARLAEADPAHGAAAYEAGRAMLRAGAPERAAPLLSRAAVSGYQEALCYELLTDAYAAQGQRAEALWARGRGQLFRGQFSAAVEAIRASLQRQPHKPLAYLDLARALQAEGRPQEALGVLERAGRVDPGNLDVRLFRAKLLLSLERVPAVVRELEAAAALDPKRANEPLGNLGTVFFDSQQYDRAQPLLERAVQAEESDAHSQFYLGRTLARRSEEPGQAEKAVHHLLRAAQLQPDYSRPWMEVASVLQRLDHLPEAAASLRRAIGGDPSSDAPYLRLAQLLQRQGRVAERRLILRRYALVRDHDLRRTGLEKETRDHPKDAERRYALGDLLLQEGRPEKALTELLAAAGLRPGWSDARNRLADACALLGYDDMREDAERKGGR